MSRYKPYPAYKKSGVEWLGDVPEHWVIAPLWSVYRPFKRTGFTGEPLLSVYRDHGVVFKDSRDDNHNRASDDLGPYQLVEPGHLVTNKMKTWQGSIAVSELRGIVSPAYFIFEPVRSVFGRFIHHLMRSLPYITGYMSISKGIRVGQWDLDADHFRTFPILFPTKTEQERIVKVLDRETTRIDALIAKKTRFIELLKEKRQALITHAVTKGLNPNVKMKDSGVEWIGDVPEHWEVKRMRHVAEYTNSNVDKKEHDGQENIHLCNYTDVYYNEFVNTKLPFMPSTASQLEIERFSLIKGDVLITKDSESPDDIGIPALVTEDMPGVVCGYHLALIRSSDYATARILHRALQSHPTKAHFFVEAPGITRYGLSQDAIGDLQMCIPPLEERNAIADWIDRETTRIDTLTEKTQCSINLLKERRSAFITAAVTGQIDIREAI